MDRQPTNILEAILYGIETTNDNVVDLSKEAVALREHIDLIQSILHNVKTEE